MSQSSDTSSFAGLSSEIVVVEVIIQLQCLLLVTAMLQALHILRFTLHYSFVPSVSGRCFGIFCTLLLV